MSGASERRSAQLEVRAQGRRLEGYAALFNIEADIGGAFKERIEPGAFTRSLSGDLFAEVVALVDHDPSRLLARTKNGSLRLAEDRRGLHFDLDVPATTLGNDMLALAERQDLGGASIGFRVPPGGDDWRGKHRTLKTIELREISLVQSWPAYEGTIVSARSAMGKPPTSLVLARLYLSTLEPSHEGR